VGCVRHPECWWGSPQATRHSGRPEGLTWRLLSIQRDQSGPSHWWGGRQTWRQTATRRP
jgi:hypothetical protein